jgi:hypothetical protein
MNRAARREDAILFVGALYSASTAAIVRSAETALTDVFGNVLLSTPAQPWNFSEYYDRELRPPVLRRFLFFENVIDPPLLVEAKLAAMEVEGRLSTEGRRLINLDPGYVTLAKVVLASRKNYSHRINLGKNIFAELELFYMRGRFNPMPYTYNDYREPGALDIFAAARTLLKQRMSLPTMIA